MQDIDKLVYAETAEAIHRSVEALLGWQHADGHWVFPLEADATIPADYVILGHYLGRINDDLNAQIGIYLRRIQCPEGGWPQFPGGAFDLSVSVKAYLALKAIGDPADAAHMHRTRPVMAAVDGIAHLAEA